MKPDYGDDPDLYQWEYHQGKMMLSHKPNGDCVYLDRMKGCTIHTNAPAVCREFDCRRVYKKSIKHPALRALFPPGVLDRGKDLLKKHGRYGR